MSIGFSDVFDQRLAEHGPPAIFTLSHDGELRVDAPRTRNFWQRCSKPPQEHRWCHCVLVDIATGWPQYALLTSPELCIEHETTVIHMTESVEAAMELVEVKKQQVFQRHTSSS